jgi:hypothetical protein
MRTHTRAVGVDQLMIQGFDNDILGLVALTGGLSVAMIWLAARLQLLDRREEPRCPACGRFRRGGGCGCAT